jgi:hypothetical protein
MLEKPKYPIRKRGAIPMITKEKQEFESFRFTFDGREYVSKVVVGTQMWHTVRKLPDGVFVQMNQQCLGELLGVGTTDEEVFTGLAKINEGGTQAFIELAPPIERVEPLSIDEV